ncbi:type VII secretion integral membrane protein EccD [Nocardia sp. alder85J]|uniref:type VII secretion integral membrane protein EccD n=1 Tax=Nocardia sp. alder85J TaxID=2862949 RepID=UPI001CD38C6F|nr:type VII secretion integral membrane protein EccD [Nocardia sp. alder85J]MCX4092200.1 type VII secretion integral membrane protein EccD [Nocardia sp. alder85J]
MSTAFAPTTAANAAPASSAEVARARIAIMVATYQVDVVLPTKFAIETFIDDLIGVLAGAVEDENVDFTPPVGQWSLARPGEPAIPRWRSLEDHEIADGAVLTLSVVESAEVFTPVVEDITDALALINEREFAEFDAVTVQTAGVTALGVAALSVATMMCWSWTRTGSWLWCGLPTILLGLVCWFAAVPVQRRENSARLGLGLALSALPLLFAGAAMLVPPAYGRPGPLAPANLAAGLVVAAVAALTMLRLVRIGTTALVAVATLGVVLAIAVAPAAYLDVSVRQVAAGVVFVAVVLLTSAPRLAVVAARIRPPDLPDPGAEVAPATLTDIFDAQTGVEPAEDEQALPVETIESRARTAVTTLRGLIIGMTALVSGGTVVAAAASPGGVREIVMAAAVAGALTLRARWHPDRVQAVALLAGAALTTIGTGFELVGAYHTPLARLLVALVVAALAGLGCVAAMSLPGRRLSPVTRRAIDLLEYALILVVPVLAFWIMGVYTAMRAI